MIDPRRGFIGLVALIAAMGNSPLQAQDAIPESLKSAKERLSDKASDEQRVNNCQVPVEKRGTKPRPDCPTPQEADKSAPGQPQPKQ